MKLKDLLSEMSPPYHDEGTKPPTYWHDTHKMVISQGAMKRDYINIGKLTLTDNVGKIAGEEVDFYLEMLYMADVKCKKAHIVHDFWDMMGKNERLTVGIYARYRIIAQKLVIYPKMVGKR